MEKRKKRGAPLGNEFWKLALSRTGRPKKYSPKGLERVAAEYFEWNDKNPFCLKKKYGGKSTSIEKPRPMTETAFRLFAGIGEATWHRYKTDPQYKDFWNISAIIVDTIYTQKFEGAALNVFNGQIIARDLGLVDKKKLVIDWENMTDDQLNKVVDLIIKRKDHE